MMIDQSELPDPGIRSIRIPIDIKNSEQRNLFILTDGCKLLESKLHIDKRGPHWRFIVDVSGETVCPGPEMPEGFDFREMMK